MGGIIIVRFNLLDSVCVCVAVIGRVGGGERGGGQSGKE